eukprot:CAMPEP_0170609704 /NCGR_PEP_ID=MMETSP0224-20130122/22266_1 /TAXON_ID=285029 /ORGANISM="Togula jolla, Strain CCCM 725" /LENGTH=404 /DNA_ID=CAMNT_0010935027 /DNA_START=24 /DNA_END=1238 /DNA_ORIENTATION=+
MAGRGRALGRFRASLATAIGLSASALFLRGLSWVPVSAPLAAPQTGLRLRRGQGTARSGHDELVLRAVSTFGATSVGTGSALGQLQGISAVVPDAFNFEEFEKLGAKLAFASSKTVLEALESETWPNLGDLVEKALESERCAIDWSEEGEGQDCFLESLFAQVGAQLLRRVSPFGQVSTEVPYVALATPAMALRSAERMMAMYSDLGVARGRVLLRVPASYAGLRAAEALSSAGYAVHLTHVYSIEQAALAAKAGVSAVQVYVGRVSRAGGDGIATAREIYDTLKSEVSGQTNVPSLIAGSLRDMADVSALSGADYLLVPPSLLQELRELPGLPIGAEGLPALRHSRVSGSSSNKLSPFLCSPEDFQSSLSPMASKLLTEGLAKYKLQQASLDELIEKVQEFLR